MLSFDAVESDLVDYYHGNFKDIKRTFLIVHEILQEKVTNIMRPLLPVRPSKSSWVLG